MKKMRFVVLPLVLAVILTSSEAYAAPTPNAGQEMGGVDRTRELEEKSKKLTEQIKKKRKKPAVEEEKLPTPEAAVLPGEKVLIKKITVTGATILPEEEIRGIVAPFENKEIPLTEMQKAADLISDAYRQKGYITSRAYIPPQKIEKNQFEIKVVEGKMGDLSVRGNHWYKASLYKKKFI